MQIEIDDTIVELIMKTELCDSIEMVKNDIKQLKKIRKRERYQQADLAHNQEVLPHLEAVYDYFGGNIK